MTETRTVIVIMGACVLISIAGACVLVGIAGAGYSMVAGTGKANTAPPKFAPPVHRRFDFDNHSYIRFGGHADGSVVHDPECGCRKNKQTKTTNVEL